MTKLTNSFQFDYNILDNSNASGNVFLSMLELLRSISFAFCTVNCMRLEIQKKRTYTKEKKTKQNLLKNSSDKNARMFNL